MAPERWRFTVDEHEQMVEAGILGDEDDRVELIHGEVIRMGPIGARHVAVVDNCTVAFAAPWHARHRQEPRPLPTGGVTLPPVPTPRPSP